MSSDSLHFGIGLIISLFLGLPIPILFNKIIRIPLENELIREFEIIEQNSGAWFLGMLERILFFISFYIGKPELIGGWLVFKLGTKWQSYANIIKICDGNGMDGIDSLNRFRFGARIVSRSLIGTLWNILSALLISFFCLHFKKG